MAQQFTLPDGRIIDYLIEGAKDGFPFVWIHGTPGAYLPIDSLNAICEKKGVKVITLSRAGYGGPHSLACAAKLKGCVAVLSVAAVAPYEAEGLDFLAGQGEGNVEEFGAALKGEEELRKFCDAQRPEMLKADVAGMMEVLATVLPEVDKKTMLGSKIGEHIVDSFRESLRVSCDGWIDDDLAFTVPWGFELSEIKVPVLLYQGSEDKMVPFAHGQWLAEHLPQDKLRKHLIQGEGHLSIFLEQIDTMMDELLTVAKV
ncbi:alpha/beta-hydrolase [Rhizodiscina lignyota]|uniref:Alpha/beta-hydrolase n=1 Tax=Rhizodiscina lignyota TaxID=1504668 RepID=A0A9P4MC22_9PEZI|nr:alpha/beta-hydrolase [Rhizodiscina lignyota]